LAGSRAGRRSDIKCEHGAITHLKEGTIYMAQQLTTGILNAALEIEHYAELVVK
jgi:hypothetical protein